MSDKACAIMAVLALLIFCPKHLFADVWIATAGGNALELAHAVELCEQDGLATITMVRTVQNTGYRNAEIALAFRIPRGAVATGLATSDGSKAQIRFSNADIMVLRLFDVAPNQKVSATITLLAPFDAMPTAYQISLPGKNRQIYMKPRKVSASQRNASISEKDGNVVVEFPRDRKALAQAKHTYLPLDAGVLLYSKIWSPRSFTTRPNPVKMLSVLDVDPQNVYGSLRLAAIATARYGRGLAQFLLPSTPPRTVTPEFEPFPKLAGILDGEFEDIYNQHSGEKNPGITAMVKAGVELFGNEEETCRVLLVTDRGDISDNELKQVQELLDTLPHGSLVHVLIPDNESFEIGLRDENHPLAPVVGRYGGIVMRASTQHTESEALFHIMGHFVKPLWVDSVELVLDRHADDPRTEGEDPGPFGVATWATLRGDKAVLRKADDGAPKGIKIAPILTESSYMDTLQILDFTPPEVWWRGRIWTGTWTLQSEQDDSLKRLLALKAVSMPEFNKLPTGIRNQIHELIQGVTPDWTLEVMGQKSRWIKSRAHAGGTK